MRCETICKANEEFQIFISNALWTLKHETMEISWNIFLLFFFRWYINKFSRNHIISNQQRAFIDGRANKPKKKKRDNKFKWTDAVIFTLRIKLNKKKKLKKKMMKKKSIIQLLQYLS